MKRYLHLIRHGKTVGNEKNMFYGFTDFPLTDEGIAQVKSLRDENIYPRPRGAAYYTSGMTRAEQTFSLIYGDTPHIRLAGLKEINFGDFETKTHYDMKNDPVYISWLRDRSGASSPPGGESLAEFKTRVVEALQTILNEAAGHSVVVCHGGVICVIMDSFFNDHSTDIFKWIPLPGRGYTIEFPEAVPAGYTAF